MFGKLVHWGGELLFWGLLTALLLELLGLLDKGRDKGTAKVLADGRIKLVKTRHDLAMVVLPGVWGVFIAADYLRRGFRDPWHMIIGACFAVGVLVLAFELPETLIVSGSGLEQAFWFRRNKRIRWEEIEEINTGTKSLFVKITGSDGTRISYSGSSVDLARLFHELKEHCGENLPPDFPSEPFRA